MLYLQFAKYFYLNIVGGKTETVEGKVTIPPPIGQTCVLGGPKPPPPGLAPMPMDIRLTSHCIHFYVATRLHFINREHHKKHVSRQDKHKQSKLQTHVMSHL